MKELIGFWLIAFAIITLFAWLEPVFTIKEKIKGVIAIMSFFTLICVGVFLMVGGV